jgi:hypothetical protein
MLSRDIIAPKSKLLDLSDSYAKPETPRPVARFTVVMFRSEPFVAQSFNPRRRQRNVV